jgi:hypothetical protein
MARAKPLSRSEVEQRSPDPALSLVDSALIERLVEIAGAASEDRKEELRHKLNCTVSAFFARRMGDKQESPARILAALKPGVKPARKLLAWLGTLPVGVLIELQAGGLEEHLRRIINRADYWQRYAAALQPAADAASSILQLSLKDIYNEHCLSLRRCKSPEERKRYLDSLVVEACKMIGARERFTGEQKLPSKRGERLYMRPLQKSAAERRLERKLKVLKDI